ncbi:hypothetical protein L484_001366 [Morus notabilis]|uniref:Uncharacterized protein n=1 Tax=Morus notabilis TaxID=981085 RepID=W9SDG9_9ROSA|nr:uncharacterized protein LOC21384969 [Morus notabilis]EXC36066.1 hypothetical protein L484_001366 [Morus notabilis]
MEKPGTPKPLPQSQSQKRKLPSPQELISHYESQGLDSREASVKVIEDLQSALFRVISSGRAKKDKLLLDASRKLDSTNSRLAVVDAKLDSKPGYVQTFAIGLASGFALKGFDSVLPHFVGAVSQIWSSVRTVTKDSDSHS